MQGGRSSEIEQTLISLFDAHRRVAHERQRLLDQCETNDERGRVIDSFDQVENRIMNTAVDQVQRLASQDDVDAHSLYERVEQSTENASFSEIMDEIKESDPGDYVRFYVEGDMVEGEVLAKYQDGLKVDDPDNGPVRYEYEIIGIDTECGVI